MRVPQRKIDIASNFLDNVGATALASELSGVPFAVACALMQKESGGKNVWGNDVGGVFASLPDGDPRFYVTESTFAIFEHYVFTQGQQSNGVGPAQITWKGFFPDMKKRGLRPWVTYDNIFYGLSLLRDYKDREGWTWEDVGTAYNGSRQYGEDFADLVSQWKKRLAR